jgi:polar amino acid transport system permease protein
MSISMGAPAPSFTTLRRESASVTAVPFALDLYGITSREIAAREFEPVPLLLVAAFWYLVVTSILMVGQYYLERYYSRGASRKLTNKQLEVLAKAQGTGAPGGGGEGA